MLYTIPIRHSRTGGARGTQSPIGTARPPATPQSHTPPLSDWGRPAWRMPRAPSGHSRGRSGQTHSTVQLAISLHSRMAGRKARSPIGTARPRPQHIRLPQHTSLVGAGRARVSRIRGPGTPTAQPRTYHKTPAIKSDAGHPGRQAGPRRTSRAGPIHGPAKTESTGPERYDPVVVKPR